MLGNVSRVQENLISTTQTLSSYTFSPPLRADCLIFTLFCSLQWLRSLSSSRRAAEAHCAASLRMRLFMKLSDSFPVPTCSSRVPMSDWKTAWTTRAITKQKKVTGKDHNCRELVLGFCAEVQQQMILKNGLLFSFITRPEAEGVEY